MAVYPGGYNELRAARLRTIVYIVSVLVIIGIVAAVGYIWLVRGGTTEPSQDTMPVAAGNVAEQAAPELSVAAIPGAVEQAAQQAEQVVAVPAETQVAVPTVVTESNQSVEQLVAEAMALVNLPGGGSRVIEARDRLNEILPMTGGQQRAFVKAQLSALADKWLFNKGVYPEDKLCASYKVNPGDLLSTIGRQYNVPYEILMQINNIDRPEALQAGVMIKVINGPFNARVSRSTFTLDLYLQNTYVKSFPVGLGKPGMETPRGRWRVKEGGKLVKPIWTDPVTGRTYHPEDPDYPLGSRWIAIDGIEGEAVGRTGFAIHGTKDPEQIGTPGSQGCIRLHNGDVITVYNMLMSGVSLVDVTD